MSFIPPSLKARDEIRVIAPARGLKLINEETRDIANKRLSDLGLNITFGKYTNDFEFDQFMSTTAEKRVSDLHDAFKDPNVKAIFTVIGGFNSNQLLKYIDFELIKNNPKIICGFSDITALLNAIHAKTGLTTYLGPHYSSFGMRHGFDYTLNSVKNTLFAQQEIKLEASKEYSDDLWFLDQEKRDFSKNDGYWLINQGQASGQIVGGNLSTLSILQGTEFMPSLKDKILFIEEALTAGKVDLVFFERQLVSLLSQKDAETIKGVVIGRFQNDSEVTREMLTAVIKNRPELSNIPVIANADFGHTTPLATIPIGGYAKIDNDNIIINQ